MRLKSLKLAGFKSFANATTFNFPRGITAIVGPNGCGKSNVIDAIRWVLGETSAKQLRGGAMSDVIFAGTQDKAAKSVASVELTFEHTQDEQTGIRHEFNLYQELSVRRQVSLQGRSDYFINGTRCRRRDVVDVFLGTGLGARSYAVIEQGMIGRIVDSSPMQLREFIEEAAGVSRYQARREETQKKLEKTRDNLARLHDMQSELVSQQKRLSKQAMSAERYNELNQTLADIQQQLAIQLLYQAKQTQQQQKVAHAHSKAEVATLHSHYQQLKAKQDKLAAHINQEQWLKDEAQSSYYQQQLNSQHAEHHVTDMHAKVRQIQQQLTDLAQQKTQAMTEIDTLKGEQTAQQNEYERLHPQLTALTLKRDAYKHDAQPLEQEWTEVQHQLASLQDTLRALEQQQALNQQSQKRYHLSADKWQQRLQNWQTLWAQLQPSDSNAADSCNENSQAHLNLSADAKMSALTDELQQIARRQESVQEYLSERQPQQHALQQRLMDEQRRLVVLEKSHALLSGEYDTLYQILHPKPPQAIDTKPSSPSQPPVSPVNSDYQPRPIRTLREQIELSTKGQEHAPLLDSVLSLWLDSHVFISDKPDILTLKNTAQSADNLWQVLSEYLADLFSYQNAQSVQSPQSPQSHQSPQNHLEARHSLWLPSPIAPQSSNVLDLVLEHLPNELIDKVIPLSQLITQPNLTVWQQSYLYIIDKNESDSAQNIIAILKALPPSARLFTTDGWMMSRQGTFHINNFASAASDGSDNQSSSPFLTQRLQQRKRLQQLEALLDDSDEAIQIQQQAIKKSQEEYDTLSISLEETRAQSEQLTREKYHYAQQLSTQKSAYERLQTDIARLNTDKNMLEQERQELAAEWHILEDEQQKIQINRQKLIPKIAEAKEKRQQLQFQRSEFARMRQRDDDEWQALQLSSQKAQMRLEHTVSNLARASQSYDNAVQNEHAQITKIEHFEQQLPDLQATLHTAQRVRDEQQALLTERETVLAALKQQYSQQQLETDKLQTDWQYQQETLATLTTELALSAARLDDASQHTQTALEYYYKITHNHEGNQDKQIAQKISVSNLLADFIAHERRVRPDKIAELEPERAKLEQQISKMGAVNLAAVAELNEVNERLQPLTQQIDDITASMQTLLDAIASIDETTKTLFMQTLDAVNNELAHLFAKVFGGGQASLTLNTDDMPTNTARSEQWRAGLTLMAQPKGKRNSRLAVLSGGEKTLTALSLIFAIFKQHPAPFCVLDEVDAPLDDANVARFTSLILDLADDLQFIFISHNKLAMQIADELKGITMPTAGISTLVSVSLDEAVQYIEN